MKVKYTFHAKEKLKRNDIKKFKITKNFIEFTLINSKFKSKTRYGDYSAVSGLNSDHDLRVIYDIISGVIKVITFHVSKKGRYR